jgi:hypothetical protein
MKYENIMMISYITFLNYKVKYINLSRKVEIKKITKLMKNGIIYYVRVRY